MWIVVFQETTLVEGYDQTTVPDKALQEKEKTLLEKFKLVLQAFLHEKTDLQVTAVYSLQVYCYTLHFPKVACSNLPWLLKDDYIEMTGVS
ncbi:unnamed protein product, partial [Timema podura]|nr:unnamed protein product [Timema podura]